MSKKIFELVELVARHIKNRALPFGGMQVIFTGDFFQLPPVGTYGEDETSQFCFESARWNAVFEKENHVELRTIFRQNDEEYKRILNQIRIGELDEASIQLLSSHVGREPPSTIEQLPTKLYAIRAKTDFVNSNMYAKIKQPEYTYEYQIKTNIITHLENGKPMDPLTIASCSKLTTEMLENEANLLINASNRQKILKLKEGAKVMCLHNLDLERDICNGSQGVVVKFVGEQNWPVIKFKNGIERVMEPVWAQSEDIPCVAVAQIPLCLAWALTIHKIQGATLDSAEMDLGNSVFEFGQTYVALSRVKNLNGLYLSAFEPSKIKANPLVKEFYQRIQTYSRVKTYQDTLDKEEKVESNDESVKHINVFSQFAYKELEQERLEETTTKKLKIKM
jgi:ATP-dependent DNA helicase PIF1